MQKVDFFNSVDKFIRRYVKHIDSEIDSQDSIDEQGEMFSNAQNIYFNYYTLENLLVTYFQDIYEHSDKFRDNFFDALTCTFSGQFDRAKEMLKPKTKEQIALSKIIPIIEYIILFDIDKIKELFKESLETKSIYINNLFYAIFLDEIDEIELSREYYIRALKLAKNEYENLRVLYFITYQDYQMCRVSDEVLHKLESIKEYKLDIKALIYYNISLGYYESSYFKEADDYLDQSIMIFQKNGIIAQLAFALLLKADIKVEFGEYDVALGIYQEILSMIDTQDIIYIKTINSKAIVLYHQKKYKEALLLHQEALSLIKKQKDKYELYRTQHHIGLIFKELRKYDEAIASFEMGISTIKSLGDRTLYLEGISFSLKETASIYRIKSEYKKSRDYILELYEIQKRLFVKNKSDYTTIMLETLEELAELFYLLGEYSRSLQVNQTLLESFRVLSTYEHSYKNNLADTLNAIAVIVAKNKPLEAIDKFGEALEILNRDFLKNPLKHGAKVAIIIVNMGMIYRKLNQTELAKTMLIEAIEILDNLNENNILYDDIIYINALNSVSTILIEAKEHKEAKEYYDKAIEILSHTNRNNYLLAKSLLEYGAMELSIGDIESGYDKVQRAYEIYKSMGDNLAKDEIQKCKELLNKYGNRLLN
jgi:tetratricopeptide (TPR) repeat protein